MCEGHSMGVVFRGVSITGWKAWGDVIRKGTRVLEGLRRE